MNKQRISWILILTVMLSIIPFNPNLVFASGGMIMTGNNEIQNASFVDDNVYVGKYEVTPSDGTEFIGIINWSLEGETNGVQIISNGGKNNKADLIVYKNQIKSNTFVIVATSQSHGTVRKEVTIISEDVSGLGSFTLTPVTTSDASGVKELSPSQSSTNVRMTQSEKELNLRYKMSATDKSTPPKEVGFSATVSVNGVSHGITTSTELSFVDVKIDRSKLKTNEFIFSLVISGNIEDGTSYTKTLIHNVFVDGIVGETTTNYDLSLKTDSSETNFIINPVGNRYVNIVPTLKKDGVVVPNPQINWKLTTSDTALSISTNGRLTIGTNAKKGTVLVTGTHATNENIVATLKLVILDATTYSAYITFDDFTKETTVSKSKTGNKMVPIKNTIRLNGNLITDKDVTYTVHPQAQISVGGNNLVIPSNTPNGKYIIKASLVGDSNFLSNEIVLNLIDENIDESKRYTVHTEMEKLNLNIPSQGKTDSATITVRIRADGQQVPLESNIALKEASTGVTIQGNKLVVSSNATEGFYSIIASLKADPNIKTETIVYVKSRGIESGNLSIRVNPIGAGSNVTIPQTDNLNVVFSGLVYIGETPIYEEPISYSLLAPAEGVQIVNNVLIITNQAKAGNFIVVAKMVNKPSVTKNIPFILKGGTPAIDAYTVQVSINGNTSITIPKQSDGNLSIPFNVVVRKNGIPDAVKPVLNSLTPTNNGIYIEGNVVIITPIAKAGTYNIVSKLKDDETVYGTTSFQLKEPVNTDIKELFITAPNKIEIPEKASKVETLDYVLSLNGKVVEKEDVNWQLLTEKDGVTLNKNILTIASSARDGEIGVRITLASDPKVTTSKKIILERTKISDKAPAKVSLSGFDNDSASNTSNKLINMKEISRNRILIKAHTFDESGVEFAGSEVAVRMKEQVEGVKLVKAEGFNEYYIIANSFFDSKNITLTAESIYSASTKVEVPVSLMKTSTFSAVMAFEKNTIVKKAGFGVEATYFNNDSKEKEVVLIIAVYRGNQMLSIDSQNLKVEKSSDASLRAKVTLPADIKDVYVKAYLAEGSTPYTSGKILLKPIIIK